MADPTCNSDIKSHAVGTKEAFPTGHKHISLNYLCKAILKVCLLFFIAFFSHLLDTLGVVFCWILAVLVGTDDSTVLNCIFQLFMRTCLCVVWVVVSLSSDVLVRSPASSFSREERANSEVFLLSIWKQNNRVVNCSKMLNQVSGVSRTLQVPLAFKERGQMRIVSYFSKRCWS